MKPQEGGGEREGAEGGKTIIYLHEERKTKSPRHKTSLGKNIPRETKIFPRGTRPSRSEKN